MNKTVEDLKVEVESLKKTQTEENVEKKNQETRTGASEVSLTNRIYKMEGRILGIGNMRKEMDTLVKENTELKKS